MQKSEPKAEFGSRRCRIFTAMADDASSAGGRSFAAQFSEIRQLENQKGRLEKSVLHARKRAEEFRMFRGDPNSTGSTADRAHEMHRQVAGGVCSLKIKRKILNN